MTDSLDLIDSISLLIAANVPGAAYTPDGVYTADQVGIFNMLLPESPDECITVTWVPLTDNPSMPQGTGHLQIRARGAANQPRRPVEILDQASVPLLGATNLPLSATATIMQVTSRIRVPMGMDQNNRWDWSDNYTLDVAYTPTALRPAGGNW